MRLCEKGGKKRRLNIKQVRKKERKKKEKKKSGTKKKMSVKKDREHTNLIKVYTGVKKKSVKEKKWKN